MTTACHAIHQPTAVLESGSVHPDIQSRPSSG